MGGVMMRNPLPPRLLIPNPPQVPHTATTTGYAPPPPLANPQPTTGTAYDNDNGVCPYPLPPSLANPQPTTGAAHDDDDDDGMPLPSPPRLLISSTTGTAHDDHDGMPGSYGHKRE
jgi:hypothetical protein